MVIEILLSGGGWRAEFATFLFLLLAGANPVAAGWTFLDAFDWEDESRSPAGWALVVALLPIVGFLLYLLLGREQPERPPGAPRRS